jgi:tetratricopeptide (TPR) repeat protein
MLIPFFKELRRRNVVRVGLAYLAVAWLIIQLINEIGPILELPDWLPKLVQGRFHLARRTADSIEHAENAFRAAIAIDPSYSPASSALATTLAVSPYYRGVGSLPALGAEAKKFARAAIDLDPGISVAYAALVTVLLGFDHDWEAAAEALTRAVGIHPNDAGNTNFYGDYLYTIGDF